LAENLWKDEYKTDIPVIDEQHRWFCQLLERLEAAFEEGRSVTFLGDALRELVSYANVHFEYEEKALANFKYSHAKEHAQEHHLFRLRLADILKDLKSGKDIPAREVIAFMRHWLTHHLSSSDALYAKEFRAKGVALTQDDLISFLSGR
jgi:hemerythrin-like metal-binding protein